MPWHHNNICTHTTLHVYTSIWHYPLSNLLSPTPGGTMKRSILVRTMPTTTAQWSSEVRKYLAGLSEGAGERERVQVRVWLRMLLRLDVDEDESENGDVSDIYYIYMRLRLKQNTNSTKTMVILNNKLLGYVNHSHWAPRPPTGHGCVKLRSSQACRQSSKKSCTHMYNKVYTYKIRILKWCV